jgi:hypothetical protein
MYCNLSETDFHCIWILDLTPAYIQASTFDEYKLILSFYSYWQLTDSYTYSICFFQALLECFNCCLRLGSSLLIGENITKGLG